MDGWKNGWFWFGWSEFLRGDYVMNNPLKYTDPSGYWWNPFKAVAKAWRSVWRGVKKYGRQIASIAVLFIPGLNSQPLKTTQQIDL